MTQQPLFGDDTLLTEESVARGAEDSGPFPERKDGDSVRKWDIFCYVYGMLHHPEYCRRYAGNLKKDLPRIPFVASDEEFWTCVLIGEALMWMHLHYEDIAPYPLEFLWTKPIPDYRVTKMRFSPSRTSIIVNPSLILVGVPPEAHGYVLGNRSALEWIIDQYQVTTDERSGIKSDPNSYAPDDPQYIVRLLCQVTMVSVKTVEMIAALAKRVNPNNWRGFADASEFFTTGGTDAATH